MANKETGYRRQITKTVKRERIVVTQMIRKHEGLLTWHCGTGTRGSQ